MKALLFLFFCSILITSFPASSADFEKGHSAGKRGDYKSALREFVPLAAEGHPEAQFHLGSMYEQGQGVTQNIQVAAKWFEQSAGQGYAQAQHNIGNMYLSGTGVEQNYRIAVKWFTLAANQGVGRSQYNLGYLYEDGYGVQKDLNAAYKWYLKSASNQIGAGMTALGIMYATGETVRQSYVRSYMWGELGSRNGSQNGSAVRDMSTPFLSSSEVEEARKLVQECVTKNYKGC